MTRRGLPIVAAVCVYVAWHVASLTRAPVAYFDDTFFANIGHTFTHSGELRLTAGPLWMRDSVYLYGPGYFLAQRAVFTLFGFGIFQNRLLPLVGGGAVIVLALALLRAAGVRRGTTVAVGVLLALDPTLNLSLHGGRMDTIALACVLASLLALLRDWSTAREPRLAVGLVAGLLAAFAVLTTPRAGFLLAVLAAFLVARWVTAPSRARALQAAAWGLPIAALSAAWIAYAFGSLGAMLTYYRTFSGDYLGGGFHLRALHVPLLAALAAALASWIASASDRRLDVLPTFALAGIAGFYALGLDPPRYGAAYAIFATPLVYLALAGLARPTGPAHAWTMRAVFAVLFVWNGAAFAARTTLELAEWRSRDPAPVAAFVRAVVPPGSRVVGDDKFYYAVVGAGADFQYWQRGGSLDERVAYQSDDYAFDYLVTGMDPTSELFRAYAARVPLIEVATFPSSAAGGVTRGIEEVARGFGVGAPLVADYGGTVFVRADRDRSPR